MFSNISLSELPLLAREFKKAYLSEDGQAYAEKSTEELLADIELVDHMLGVLKSKSLLNKKRGTNKMLDGLLAMATGDETVVPGSANNHLMQ